MKRRNGMVGGFFQNFLLLSLRWDELPWIFNRIENSEEKISNANLFLLSIKILYLLKIQAVPPPFFLTQHHHRSKGNYEMLLVRWKSAREIETPFEHLILPTWQMHEYE